MSDHARAEIRDFEVSVEEAEHVAAEKMSSTFSPGGKQEPPRTPPE
jgi:hypothetical protein